MSRTEMLQPMHDLVRELLEREALGNGHKVEFTDDDVVGATLLFCSIMGNRMAHRMHRHNPTLELSEDLGEHFGNLIREVVKGMTGVDTQTHYHITRDGESDGV